jgi:MFS family permease
MDQGSRTQVNNGAAEVLPVGRAAMRLNLLLRALRHRNFQLFFGGQLISLIGTWMQNVALSWLVYRLTGSALLLGIASFAGQIPVFLLAPVGGVVADRLNRHRVVIGTQTAAMVLAFILAGLALAGRVQVWHILVLASLLGVVNAFDIPARQAFVVELVGREGLLNAIALNSSMFNGARVIGPAIAGVLVAAIGEGWCFFANGVSYIAVIVALLAMVVKPRLIEHPRRPALEAIAEGFRFVWHAAPIRSLLLLLGLVSVVGMPYSVLMPIFAGQILHGGPRGLGMLMGATGVGALAGAMALAMRSGLRGLGRWVAAASGGFGASIILFSFSRWFWVSAALLVPAGFAMMTQMASANTLIQAMAPDRLRGRVMSIYSMMIVGMAPIGALIAGAIADVLGAPLTVAVGGAGCLVGAAFFAGHLPVFRPQARQLILAQATASGEPAEDMTVRLQASGLGLQGSDLGLKPEV